MAEAGRKSTLAAWVWVLVAGIAVFELVAQPLTRAAVPSDESWEEAAAFVRERFGPNDRIVASPPWVEPIVRHHLGDLLTVRTASTTDFAGVDRVWEVSIRGARVRDERPDLDEEFGGVHVRRYPVLSDAVLYDFVEQVEDAEVELISGDSSELCPLVEAAIQRGGLERGPIEPVRRHVCDPERPWLWVGATVIADLELEPRRCVWQHPAGAEPVRVTFRDVPLGERLVVHGGLDYFNDRRAGRSPVYLRIWIDDSLAGELIHEDRDGWARLEIDTSAFEGRTGEVRFETTAQKSFARTFCWSASTRQPRSAP